MILEDKQISIERMENGFILRMNGYDVKDENKRTWITRNWGFPTLDEALAKIKEEFN